MWRIGIDFRTFSSGGNKRYVNQPLKTWSSNWSLLEAKSSGWEEREIKPLAFSIMLDYLDARKNEQVLSSLDTQKITLGGREVHLRGYRSQLGGGESCPRNTGWMTSKGWSCVLGRQQCLLAVEEEAKI